MADRPARSPATDRQRVTGIGGVFWKAADPEGNKIELWEPASGV
jgi:predicted enzyme related to lactoylglutathione lyase